MLLKSVKRKIGNHSSKLHHYDHRPRNALLPSANYNYLIRNACAIHKLDDLVEISFYFHFLEGVKTNRNWQCYQ